MAPRSAVIRSAVAATWSGSETSAAYARPEPPAAWHSAATCSACSPRRSTTATRAPSDANRSALARPMPCPPPVTTAT